MNQYYLDVKEIMKLTKMKQGYAYKVIRELNKELEEKGYMTVRGRVPRKYFIERMGLN